MDERLKNIDVNEPIILAKTGQEMQEQTQEKVMDITKMSPDEIQAYVDHQKTTQKAEKEKRYNKFLDEKDEFVINTANKFERIHGELKTLKEESIKLANKLYDTMYAIKDKTPKEVKSFQLVDKSNNFKITLERAERFKFTEEATVHIHAIKDIFKEKFEGRNKGFYAVLDGILMRNSKGEYDAKLLAKARQQIKKLGDQELINEFEALEHCQFVESASTYVRAYVKDENGKWEDINVQFSSL